jgi:hypothetical protein
MYDSFFKIENIGWKYFTLLICASDLFWTHDVYMQKIKIHERKLLHDFHYHSWDGKSMIYG